MPLSKIIENVSRIDNGSAKMMKEIKKHIAGGASSTMRVLPYHKPLVISKAKDEKVWDMDNNELIDYNMAYGPLIFGHRSEIVNNAIKNELDIRGAVIGYPVELYNHVGELIKDAYPSIDLLRFSSSGTEVDQTAIRLARTFTGRTNIVLFEGHYHGSSDSLFHKYGAEYDELVSNSDFRSLPGTNGMGGAPHNAYSLPWNDLELLDSFLKDKGHTIAALIMEPVMGNSGVIPPKKEFLKGVRKLADKYGIVLIFDEVITGFRIARGGAQQRYDVSADITTFSKALTGGFPVSAIGGKQEIMELLINGQVFHGGVYSGNPLGLAVTYATQSEYKNNEKTIYSHLEEGSNRLAKGIKDIFDEVGIEMIVQNVGAMISLRFLKDGTDGQINDYRDFISKTDPIKFILFQHDLQDEGVYIHPNQIEPLYFSMCHTDKVVDVTLEKIRKVAKNINFKI